MPWEPKLVPVIGSFEKSRFREYRPQAVQIQWKQGLVRDIGRLGKPRVREIGIPLYSFRSTCCLDFLLEMVRSS